MRKKLVVIATFLFLFSIIASSYITSAKASDEIIFKDKNLQNALSKFYDWNETFTIEKARELSQRDDSLFIDYCDISNLEGLQYFDNLIQVNLRGNSLNDLQVLTKLKKLSFIDISYSNIKGKEFVRTLNDMGKNDKLDMISLMGNEISNISFLNKIGNIKNYSHIYMNENRIEDISILKNAINLNRLDLADNRITDVSPLKDLKNIKYYLDLRDNCIIDYKPVKPILDKLWEDENEISRYDYYTNPVNIGVNRKTVKFPYLTVYYKYQAYVEAVPLFKALGGSAKYNKKTGSLTCKYNGNTLVIKDFSNSYTLNGELKSMEYPMRRMQYDLAYVPVEDICKALGLKCSVTKKRRIYEREDAYFYAPKYIEISNVE